MKQFDRPFGGGRDCDKFAKGNVASVIWFPVVDASRLLKGVKVLRELGRIA